MASIHSRSERIYRTLLHIYPREFRTAAGPLMQQVFRDMYAKTVSAAPSRAMGLLRLWSFTTPDLLVSAFSAWRERLGMESKKSSAGSSSARVSPPQTPRRFGPEILNELRIASRSLVRTPAFTLVAVAILGLGIGANTTIFSIVQALYLDAPPHVQEPDQLVRVQRTSETTQVGGLGYPNFADIREMNQSFDGLMAYDASGIQLTLADGDRTASSLGWFVTSNYFDVLGVQPELGRWFTEVEERPGESLPVAVIGYELWSTMWSADPSVIGRTISLNGQGVTIVGVAPRNFRGVSPIETPPDLWMPVGVVYALSPATCPCATARIPGESWYWLGGVGRLRDGVTIEQANADLARISLELERVYPEWNEGAGSMAHAGVTLAPGRRNALASMTRMLGIAAGIVLLVSAINLAILLLARGSTKVRDTGVRLALGAGRGVVLRNVLAETTVICVLGAGLGLALAYAGGPLASELLPATVVEEVRPRGGALVFAIITALLTGWVAASVPAWQAFRMQVVETVKGGGLGRSKLGFRNVLVVVQVALSAVLIAGAVLFARSLMEANQVELGFEREDRILIAVNLANHGYDGVTGPEYVRRVLASLEATPGVLAASTTRMQPFRGRWSRTIGPVEIDRTDPDAVAPWIDIGFNAVSPGYFQVMGIPLLEGREFTDRDDAAGPRVVIVNETMAEQGWPGESPIGKVLTQGEPGTEATIVGLVSDATYYQLGEDPRTQGYAPALQAGSPLVRFLVHLSTVNQSSVAAVRDRILEQDRAVAISSIVTLEDAFDAQLARFRTAAVLVSLFGVLALMLSAVGLYGVLSYLVTQRTREIGIRVALGASRDRVRRHVLTRGMVLVVVGISLGLVGAVSLSRMVTSFIFGIQPIDPVSMVSMVVMLLSVAIAASLVPASRAVGISPLIALQSD